jgi:iron(III) transport system substrate-binding protein
MAKHNSRARYCPSGQFGHGLYRCHYGAAVTRRDKGWDYWKQFNANVWQYTKSGAVPAQHVGQGEAAVGVVFSHDIVAQMEKGFPIVLSFAQEGMGWEIGGMAIVKGTKHADLAKAWFDWALEPATQELGPKYTAYQAPTVKGAKPSRPELLQVKLIDYDFDYAGKNKKVFVDKFTNDIAAALVLRTANGPASLAGYIVLSPGS